MPSVMAPLATSDCADHEAEHGAGGDGALHRPPQPDERPLATDRAVQHPRAVLDEAPHGVHAGTVGSQVLGRRQAFLDAAVEAGVGAHLVGGLLHGAVAHPHEHGDGHAQVDGHAQAEAPVEHGQHDQHAGDEEDAPGGTRDDAAEEVGHRCDVAVDALDQLAWRVAAVELVVEPEHVAGDAQAELVRRAPRRHRGEPGDDDGDDLGGHGDGEERQCQPHELGGAGPLRRLVHDGAHDERAGERQCRAAREERAENGPTTGVGPQEGEQGAPARRGFNRHPPSLPPRPRSRRVGFVRRALLPLATGSVLSSTLGPHGTGHLDCHPRSHR